MINTEIVIRFFEIIRSLVEHPEDKRDINWKIRFFEKEVDQIEETDLLAIPARTMLQEIFLCQKRRRSRKHMYNASLLDEILASYRISNHSQRVLSNAWNTFVTEMYKVA